MPQTDLFLQAPARLSEWAPGQWPVTDDWRPVIARFLACEAGQQLGKFMRARLADGATIYPPQPFLALQLTALAQVKVVILGQDPYHGPGQAQGLAFSVPQGVRTPPSLKNIFKEIARDPGLRHPPRQAPGDGSLIHWARQGVLLLNTSLTVEEGKPASHAGRGWETLTDDIVRTIAQRDAPTVFLLWGAHAQAKQSLIVSPRPPTLHPSGGHQVLTANHPSPLSALRPPKPFLGCGHFSAANTFLVAQGQEPIEWQ